MILDVILMNSYGQIKLQNTEGKVGKVEDVGASFLCSFLP